MVASKSAKGNVIDSERQSDLFLHPPIGLEDRLDGKTLQIGNNAEGYGFNLDSLASFRSKKPADNYRASQYLFYGMMDMERVIGVPHAVHESMTTAESAAMYIGDAKLKTLGSVTIRRGKNESTIKYSELRNKPVEEIIATLVAIGFQYSAVRRMKNKGFYQHSTGKGDLRKRIAELPAAVKQMFLLTFSRMMAVSNVDDKVRFDFIDPDSEGALDYTAAKSYTTQVAAYMKGLYQRRSEAKR